METIYFLGIDVSKKKFDAALTTNGMHFHHFEVENQSNSITVFFNGLKKLIPLDKLIVCLEHTGIYSHPLLDVLVKKQVNVCVEHALHIKQSQGMTRGKNDKVDAQRIALYAFKNRDMLRFWKPHRPAIQKLKALLVMRERLVKIKTQLTVPIHESEEFIDVELQKTIVCHSTNSIKAIQKDIVKIERQIDLIVQADSKLVEQCKLITSVPGVGKIIALNMIICTSEFTTMTSSKKFACYAGIAPFEHTSGSSIRGKTRVSKKANMTLKRLLHMGAMSAIQSSEEIRIFYQRKVASGKNKMTVLNAVRNKLISRVFACITHGRVYQKNYRNTLA